MELGGKAILSTPASVYEMPLADYRDFEEYATNLNGDHTNRLGCWKCASYKAQGYETFPPGDCGERV